MRSASLVPTWTTKPGPNVSTPLSFISDVPHSIWDVSCVSKTKPLRIPFFLDEQKYSIHGGGFPLKVKGIESVVGMVVVLRLRQDLDHMIIYYLLKEFVANYKQMQHASNKANHRQTSTQQAHYSIQSQKLPQKSSIPLSQSSQCSYK